MLFGSVWEHCALREQVGLNCTYNVLYYVDIVKLFWNLMYGALKFLFALFDPVIVLNAELRFWLCSDFCKCLVFG